MQKPNDLKIHNPFICVYDESYINPSLYSSTQT